MGIKITAVGSYLPKNIVTNDQLAQTVDTSDEWIRSRTGIAKRHIAQSGESASMMATEVARSILAQRGIGAEEIDLIIVSTMTGDYPVVSVACQVQAAIGAIHAGAFDIMLACTGFVSGVLTATGMINSGMIKNALVIGSEVFSSITDWEDRTTCILIGDGAGGVMLEPSEQEHFLGSLLRSNGSQMDILKVPAGGAVIPASLETVLSRQHFLKMRGSDLFEAVVPMLVDLIEDTCAKANLELDNIHHFVLHQANIHFIEAVADILDLPHEKFVVHIQDHANTSSASIPLALNASNKQGRFKEGDLVMMVGFGAGLACGAIIVRWSSLPQ